MTIAQIDKNRLRREARTLRGEAAIAFPDAGVRLADNLDALRRSETRWIDGASVSAFWPMGDEIDVRPTMRRLDAAGYPILLPVMVAKATPLMFRRWRPDTVLVDGGFGTSMPPADAPEVRVSRLVYGVPGDAALAHAPQHGRPRVAYRPLTGLTRRELVNANRLHGHRS